MRIFQKPTIFISRCIEFDSCRYNGDMISSPEVRAMIDHVNFIHHCPEDKIGLGTPRDALRLVVIDGNNLLIQSNTELDVTEKMISYADKIISQLPEMHGFILKSRSPSCGIKDVKAYPRTGKVAMLHKKAKGIFAERVIESFQNIPIEDEGRLRNLNLREHFFRHIFTLADFSEVKKKQKIRFLTEFHSRNKYLFMAYNQKELKISGAIAANHEKRPFDEVIDLYEQSLHRIFNRLPRISTNINVAQHIFGYFSKFLSSKEKEYFLSELERYIQRKIPLSTIMSLLKMWVVRFENPYLEQQTYFEAFPEALLNINTTGKGRLQK
ncbi:MAG: DUF523 and DUF1722 domain-containing protein [Candidatus Cloacimonetes bacterium]|nr:DUF523 and DUF1722 domain-containing protein [Candidatus Cloacimonadota bacterium]